MSFRLPGMTIFAWKTKTDFTGAGPYLFAALMVLGMFGFMLSILSLSASLAVRDSRFSERKSIGTGTSHRPDHTETSIQ